MFNMFIDHLIESGVSREQIIAINFEDIEILAIGIGHDVSRYYKKAVKISDVNELGDVMINQLSNLFKKDKVLN